MTRVIFLPGVHILCQAKSAIPDIKTVVAGQEKAFHVSPFAEEHLYTPVLTPPEITLANCLVHADNDDEP